jgi:hypothetical protein
MAVPLLAGTIALEERPTPCPIVGGCGNMAMRVSNPIERAAMAVGVAMALAVACLRGLL